jgi:hypothetical protein
LPPSLVLVRLLVLTLAAAVTAGGCGTSASDATDIPLPVRFTSLEIGGDRYDLQTAALTHVAPATKGEDAATIGIGAGAGAVIGGLLGGGDGAAKGAVIGGGAGTGVVLATKGKDMRLGPGADVTSRLTAPLTVRTRVG